MFFLALFYSIATILSLSLNNRKNYTPLALAFYLLRSLILRSCFSSSFVPLPKTGPNMFICEYDPSHDLFPWIPYQNYQFFFVFGILVWVALGGSPCAGFLLHS